MVAGIEMIRREDYPKGLDGKRLRDGSPVATTEALYHGGRSGLNIGDLILAPKLTGYLRPQVCAVQSGVPVRWLDDKPSYRSDYCYATRYLPLARDHAAGFSNWSAVTSAADVMGRLGSVYEVRPFNCLLEFDWPVVACCCLQSHPIYEPCQFRAKRFQITRVVEKDIQAVHNQQWRGMLQTLGHSYRVWTERSGKDWW